MAAGPTKALNHPSSVAAFNTSAGPTKDKAAGPKHLALARGILRGVLGVTLLGLGFSFVRSSLLRGFN